MDSSRSTAIKLYLAHEGGYVNNKKDPGGPTNKGVTQRVYDAFRIEKGLSVRSVERITVAEANEIYSRQYLDPIRYDQLPAGLGYALGDYAINSGVSRAVKDMQRTLVARGAKLRIDSQLGMDTLKAIRAESEDGETESLILELCDRRLKFMRSLRTWKTFGKGWTRRIQGSVTGVQSGDNGVIDYAIAMVQGAPALKGPKEIGTYYGEVNGRATESSKAVVRTSGGAGAPMAGAGAIGSALQEAAGQIQGVALDGWLGDAAQIGFILLTLGGVGLLTYSWYQRTREQGAI